jgi:uncharacterized protein YukE
MNTSSIQNLHSEHEEWLDDVTAWHNELVYYNRVLLRLLEGVKIGPDTDEMEKFKSRFDNLQDDFEKLREHINGHENTLAGANGAADSSYQQKHEDVRKKVKEFKKAFQDVKNDFFAFEEKFIYE